MRRQVGIGTTIFLASGLHFGSGNGGATKEYHDVLGPVHDVILVIAKYPANERHHVVASPLTYHFLSTNSTSVRLGFPQDINYRCFLELIDEQGQPLLHKAGAPSARKFFSLQDDINDVEMEWYGRAAGFSLPRPLNQCFHITNAGLYTLRLHLQVVKRDHGELSVVRFPPIDLAIFESVADSPTAKAPSPWLIPLLSLAATVPLIVWGIWRLLRRVKHQTFVQRNR